MKQFLAPVLCFSLLFTGILLMLRGSSVGASDLPKLGKLPATVFESSAGAPLKTLELEGNVVLWNFFFTSCEGPCPALQARMLNVQGRLKRTPNIKLVSVSIDYETDTPEKLKDYAAKLGADERNWSFVRLEPSELESFGKNGFKVGLDSAGMIHSTRIALVDPTGEVRGLYDSTEPEKVDKLVEDAKALSASWFPVRQ